MSPIAGYANDPEHERLLSDAKALELDRLLASRCKASAEKRPPWDEFPGDVPTICWTWHTYGEPGDLTAYLETQLSKPPAEASRFLMTFVSTAWGLESGLPQRGDLRREHYDMVARLIDPTKILGWLRESHGTVVDQGEYHQPQATPFESRVAIQFGAIHRRVQAGTTEGTSDESSNDDADA